ncbi:hypothetical protein K2X05_11150 [bacterium]|nr:hypothetical protein [bacterium]
MNFSDIKEKFIESFQQLASRVQESSLYIQLMERYRNFNPLMQKLIVVSLVFLVLFAFYLIPDSFVSSSVTYEESFQVNRRLVRDLFRTARNPMIRSDQFKGPDFDEMKSLIEAQMMGAQIMDSQKGAFLPVNKPLPSKLVPGAIQQTGLSFEVKKLNLTQIVQLSQKLSSLHPNTKLSGVDIQADKEDPHYFQVKFTMSSLSLPIKDESAPLKKKR